MCFDKKNFSRAHAKGKKDLNDFKFGTFVGRFPSDGAASIAVKRLNLAESDICYIRLSDMFSAGKFSVNVVFVWLNNFYVESVSVKRGCRTLRHHSSTQKVQKNAVY